MSVAISDAGGDYGAVIVSGANLLVDPAASPSRGLWQGARALILQNEMPDAINIAAARAARAAGAIGLPQRRALRPLVAELAALIDVLVVNAIEAEELGGVAVTDLASAPPRRPRACRAVSCRRRHGRRVTASPDCARRALRSVLPALPVTLVSTHGAGDAFVGALAHAMALKQSLRECLETANAAAANHVSAPAG